MTDHSKEGESFHSSPLRIGMIVPSSNVTMEHEIPQMLRAHENLSSDRFTFHSSRVRLKRVAKEELIQMNTHADRAALELGDAGVDIVLYACLVAVMVEGKSAHVVAEERLKRVLATEGISVPIITSAGALVETLHDINASRVAIVAPYLPTLTKQVCNYLENEQIEVASSCSLSVDDNLAVGRLNPEHLLEIAPTLPKQVDAVVLSACVQMPSLDVIAEVENLLGVPVISAATATLYRALTALGIQPKIPGYGGLLSGNLLQHDNRSV